MDRIAPKLVFALVVVILLLVIWLQSARTEAAKQASSAALYQRSAESLIASLDALEKQRDADAEESAKVVARLNETEAARERDRATLKKLRAANENLRAYLDARMPLAVADWLWLPAGGGNASGTHTDSSGALSADAKAGVTASGVTHAEGWQWCKDLDRAFDSCNADKARIAAIEESRRP